MYDAHIFHTMRHAVKMARSKWGLEEIYTPQRWSRLHRRCLAAMGF